MLVDMFFFLEFLVGFWFFGLLFFFSLEGAIILHFPNYSGFVILQ